tara:strand:+ start:90 stop:296 length:207 start_codon:yes stop_codon:yes gene_type:complete
VKQKNNITKHDLIRSIKLLNAKIDYIDNAVVSVSGMFREFVTFMEFEDQFLDYLEAKTEEEDGEHKQK